MTNETVSVIITTYKRTETLEKAIRSVLGQTYGKIELLVVDDNGGNEYSQHVEEIVSKFGDAVKLIKNNKNLGGALARNEGIKNASSDYVAFLDDDDYYLNTKIEKQMKVIQTNENIALVYNWYRHETGNGKVITTTRKTIYGNAVYESMKGCIAPTSLWLCRKDALLDVGMFTDTPCKQDSYVILKLMLKGYEVAYVPEVLSAYGKFYTDRISTKNHQTRIEGEEKLRELCRNNYHLLTKKEQKNVEYYFNARLAEHFLGLGRYKDSMKCFISFLPHLFRKETLIAIKHCAKVVFKQ